MIQNLDRNINKNQTKNQFLIFDLSYSPKLEFHVYK